MGTIKKIKIFFGKLFDTPPEADEIGIAYNPSITSGNNVAIRKSGEGSGNAYVHQFWVDPQDVDNVNDPSEYGQNLEKNMTTSNAQAFRNRYLAFFTSSGSEGLVPNRSNNAYAYLTNNG